MRASALLSGAVLLALLAGCAGPVSPTQDLPQAAIYNTQLAVDALQRNNLQEAKARIDRALSQDSRNAEVQAAGGLIYERLGDDRTAESHYSRAVSLAPQNPAVLNNYAVFLCRRGDAERGQRLFLQAAANPLYRTPEVAYVNAGNCARGAGDAVRAEEHFRSALGLNPRNAEALYQMAELEFESGNHLPSRGFLERFMGTAPATPAALWLGVRLERASGNPQAAETYANRLRNQFPTAVETRRLLESERDPG